MALLLEVKIYTFKIKKTKYNVTELRYNFDDRGECPVLCCFS